MLDSTSQKIESSSDNDAHSSPDVVEFRPQEENNGLQRSPSMLQRMQSKLSFFNERLVGERKNLLLKFGVVYLVMAVAIMGIFSIYWGSAFNRESRFKNLRMLVVIEDENTVDGVAPAIGDTLRQILQTPDAEFLGDWLVQNTTEFNEMAMQNNNTIYEEIVRQVHRQNYWSSIYVKPNASVQLYEAIVTGDVSYNVSYNSIVSYYETGRDFLSMNLYVTPNVKAINTMLLAQQRYIVSSLLANASSDVLSNPGALAVVSTPLEFTYIDGRPFTDPVLVAPSQVGLIYMIIITFFAFNFFGEIHLGVAKFGLKPLHFALYRLLSTVGNFFVISFFYSLVTLCFQVNFTLAFGRAGFVVYWMTNFLTMWAVGAMNEVAGMLLIIYYPPLVGFWMLFWVIINISPTFAPLALSPQFYRYGYGMPIHASYEITKVIFFNTWKGEMGRNYGILMAWVVIATGLLMVVSKFFGKKMGQKAAAARAQIVKELEAQRAKDEEEEVAFDR